MPELTGIVEDIIFRNEENGYTIFQLGCEDALETVVGTFPLLTQGEHIRVEGDWVQHKEYGVQFKASGFSIEQPKSLADIEAYLGSGQIKGVGPSLARAIVDVFGEQSLDILEMAPHRLTEVPGIGPVKAQQIADSYGKIKGMRESMLFLQKLDVSTKTAARIYKVYGDRTVEKLKINPYMLVDDVSGIGFKTADKIALKMGIEVDSPFRLTSGVRFVLSEAGNEGHMFLPKTTLIQTAASLLGAEPEHIQQAVITGVRERKLILTKVNDEEVVYLYTYYNAELQTANRICALQRSVQGLVEQDVSQELEEYEKEQGVTLAQRQKDAVRSAINNGILVITGGPGTGKTTTINCIISLFQRRGMKILLGAPTGRAAKRMSEATGQEAKTIHRLLEYTPKDEGFSYERNEENPLECDVCIIDEVSMVDIFLMKALLDALAPGTRLILVGDADQLSSVGAGNVLRDIINSGMLPVVRLNEIFRQAAQSYIVINAHRINNGEFPILNAKDKDFFFEPWENEHKTALAVLELCVKRLPNHFNLDPMKDIQVLCPQKKGECGVNNLNRLLQRVLNPPQFNKPEAVIGESIFRQGDKVMQIKNNYQQTWKRLMPDRTLQEGEGVYNGDIGYIEDIDPKSGTITIMFEDNRIAEYDFTTADNLMLAYAISVHKSQGCEFKVVVMPLAQGNPMLYTRNLLYTAITRAKQAVVLLGGRKVIEYMVRNNTIDKRNSALDLRLKSIIQTLKAEENTL